MCQIFRVEPSNWYPETVIMFTVPTSKEKFSKYLEFKEDFMKSLTAIKQFYWLPWRET